MKTTSIALGIIVQALILAGTYLQGVYPLLVGREIVVRTTLRDPRHLLMGQYVDLNYDFSIISLSQFDQQPDRIRKGQVLYVSLKEQEGIWTMSQVSLTPPAQGLFLKGRSDTVCDRQRNRCYYNNISVTYGIERFFASPERALEAERKVRSGQSHVRLSVAPDGQGAIKKLEFSE